MATTDGKLSESNFGLDPIVPQDQFIIPSKDSIKSLNHNIDKVDSQAIFNGEFEIIKKLGEGATSRVYEAKSVIDQKSSALKLYT